MCWIAPLSSSGVDQAAAYTWHDICMGHGYPQLCSLVPLQVVSIFHNSSVIFAVSGAAMGNAIFMRKGSVYVDIGPVEYHWDFVTMALGNLGTNAQVKVLKYSVSDPKLKPLRCAHTTHKCWLCRAATIRVPHSVLLRRHTCSGVP
jgi:hypothetical protein